MYQGYMLKITEIVSGIHVKRIQRVQQGYMLKITEIESGKHVKDYRDFIRDTC